MPNVVRGINEQVPPLTQTLPALESRIETALDGAKPQRHAMGWTATSSCLTYPEGDAAELLLVIRNTDPDDPQDGGRYELQTGAGEIISWPQGAVAEEDVTYVVPGYRPSNLRRPAADFLSALQIAQPLNPRTHSIVREQTETGAWRTRLEPKAATRGLARWLGSRRS